MDEETCVVTEYADGLPVMHIEGEFEHSAAPAFREQVLLLVDKEHANMIVDMAGVTFMDSGGMSAIIFAVKQFSGIGGRVALAKCNDHICRKLSIGGLTKLTDKLVLTASVQEAVELFR